MNKIFGIGVLSLCMGAFFLRPQIAASITSLLAEIELIDAPKCTLTADKAYDQSIELLSDGKQVEAEELIDSALKRYRNDPRIVFAKAVLERSRWNKSLAAVWFRDCAENTGYLKKGAELTLALDRHENVAHNMDTLTQLSDDHPDDIYLLWLSAIQCREQEMGALGKERYELLLKKFTVGPVMLHQTYANILTKNLHDYETAIKHREIALSMSDGDWALQGMANTLTDSGKNAEALPIWKQLVERKPNNGNYLHRYGTVLQRLERFSEAVPVFQKTVKLDPKDEYAWQYLGQCMSMLGRYAEAFDCYQRAAQLEENTDSVTMTNRLITSENGKYTCLPTALRQTVAECYLLGRGVEKNPELVRQYCGDSVEQYVDATLRLAESMEEMDVRSLRAASVFFEDGTKLMTSCNVLDVMVAICEDAGRIDLAVATQQRLIERCQNITTDQPLLKFQRERLLRLKSLL